MYFSFPTPQTCRTSLAVLAMTLTVTLSPRANPPGTVASLTREHTDIGVAYADGDWDLHVHNESDDIEYAPSDVLLIVDAASETVVPAGSSFSFLGSAGSPLWMLPQSNDPRMLFLGFGAEELDAAEWIGDVTVTLKSVSGPGEFFVWQTDEFDFVSVFMNSSAMTGGGVSSLDRVLLKPGGHTHGNFGFSTPGDYTITLSASGTHMIDGFSSSGDVDYCFRVVPEPGSAGLLLFAGAALVLRRQRR